MLKIIERYFYPDENDPMLWRYTSYLFIIIGIILRLNPYLYNRPLWLDEAMLALSPIHLDFQHFLTGSLEYKQFAPVGFMMISRTFVLLFGDSELSLRLLPFLGSILTLYLFFRLAEMLLVARAVPWAVLLMVTNEALIYYATEYKPYSTDVTCSLILLILSVNRLQHKLVWQDFLILGGGGSILIWFSFPTIFTLAAIGFALLIISLKRSEREIKEIAGVLIMGVIWIVNFYLHMKIQYSDADRMSVVQNYYQERGFFPQLLIDIADNSRVLFQIAPDLFHTSLAFFLFLLGMGWYYKSSFGRFVLFLTPFVLFGIAAVFHYYPFYGRLVLILTPIFVVCVVEGAFGILSTMNNRLIITATLLVMSLVLPSLVMSMAHLLHPRLIEDVRTVYQQIATQRQTEDRIYSYYATNPATLYYTARLAIPKASIDLGTEFRKEPQNYIKEVEKLSGRVWVVFSHVIPEEYYLITNYLIRRSKPLKIFEGQDAVGILFDFDHPFSETKK